MSNRPLVTKELTDAVESLLNPYHDTRIYIAKEVTFDYRTEQACIVDLMRFKPINNTISGIEKGDFYCYEVKSSIEDFHSKNGHNFIGDYNYYVMPKDVYDKVKGEIPYEVGVLVSDMKKDEVLHQYQFFVGHSASAETAKPVVPMPEIEDFSFK